VSQEINLYAEHLRPRHELASGRRVAIALGLLLAVIVALGVVTRGAAQRSSAELSRLQGEVTVAQEAFAALAKTLAERKVPAALQTQIDDAKAQLTTRQEAMALLDSGQVGNSSGFSGLLSGFARLASNDLWLTGFSVSQGGQEIEIRGRLLDSSRLPAYVARLAAEPAFTGRRFATLDMKSIDPATAKSEAAASVPDGAALPALPRYIEFVLRSESFAEAAAADGGKK